MGLAFFGNEREFTFGFPDWPQFDNREMQGLERVLRSRRWFAGFLGGDETSEVGQFEKEFADYNNSRHAIAVSNGEAALIIALAASGVGAGDEVIMPAWTFVATASAAMHLGAVPVFADVTPDNLCLDPKDVLKKVSDKTRAVITVHYGGRLGNIDELVDIAQKKNLILIEDACHAHGSVHRGKKAGTLGHLGCFSFQESKTMTSGEGGLITTNDDHIAQVARSFRSNGRKVGSPGYLHYRLGWNYRLTEFQAAILRAQLSRLDEQVRTRTENSRLLTTMLNDTPGFIPLKDPEGTIQNSCYLYPIRLDLNYFGMNRELADKYAEKREIGYSHSLAPSSLLIEDILRAEGIPCSSVYIPLNRSPLFLDTEERTKGLTTFERYIGVPQYEAALPVSDRAFEEVVDLPLKVFMGDTETISTVARAFSKISSNVDQIKGYLKELSMIR